MKFKLLFTLIIPLLVATGCQKQTAKQVLPDKPKGDLTREVAAEILNEHLASFSIQQLSFRNDGGVERAEQDGVVEKLLINGDPGYRFTDHGLKMIEAVGGQNDIAYAGWGNKKYNFNLKNGIGQRVSEVTGIADGEGPNTKIVEYVTAYLLPPEMQPMTRYIYSGTKGSLRFRKYDDGWRVSK